MIKGIQNLINMVKTIINGIQMLFQFFINLLKSLLDLVRLLMTTVGNTTTIITTLPSWLIAFATATLGVSVLYMVIGRQTGKNKGD